MKTRTTVSIVVALFLSVGTSSAANWATSEGSCYGQWSKNISFGMSLLHFGGFAAFDLGVHDCISAGIATGYNGYGYSRYWRYNYVPIAGRAAFHPFNLRVLADKVRVRDKLDVYLGLASGGRIGWARWEGSGDELKEPNVGGFFIREYIGIRFFPKDFFYLVAEEGSGLGTFNLGVGFKF